MESLPRRDRRWNLRRGFSLESSMNKGLAAMPIVVKVLAGHGGRLHLKAPGAPVLNRDAASNLSGGLG